MTEIEAIEAELIQRELANRQQSQEQQTQQPQEQQPQSRLQQRPSVMADLIQNPTTMQHPLGALLRTLGGAAELYQGVPASVALDLQSGKPQNILPNIGKVLTGQRPAEYGDIFRGAGVPESLAAAGGLYSDIVMTPGGAEGLIGVAKLGTKLAKGSVNILKNITKFDKVLDQAKRSKTAIDAIRTTLGQAKDLALQEVKDLPVDFDWSKLPDKAKALIKTGEYGVEFSEEGKIINTIGNLDKVKSALQDLLTTKDYVEAGNMAKRNIKQFAGLVRDTMVKAANDAKKPELAKSLANYHEFMDKYELINTHLVDKFGNAMGNKLRSTFRLTAEPAVKEAWKEVAKTNPELKTIIRSRKNRELLKALLGTTTALEVGKKLTTGRW